MKLVRSLTRYAMELVLPAGGALEGAADTDVESFFDQVAQDVPLMVQAGVVAAAAMIVVSPVLTLGIPVPVFVLPERLRDEHVYRLSTHKIYLVRQLTTVLKMAAGMEWGRDPAVRAKVGAGEMGPDPGTWRESF